MTPASRAACRPETTRLASLVAAGTLVAGLAVVGSPTMVQASPEPTAAVVVMARPGYEARTAAALIASGGHVTRLLPIINGFAATIPLSREAALESVAGVVSVTPDRVMQPMSVVPALGYDPTTNLGSLSQVSQFVGAQTAWADGYTGAGVDVALIDTGVTRVSGLDESGKVVNGPDLSFDQGSPSMTGLDAYGHGTFMASLIAGRDDTATASAVGCTTCLNSSGYSDITKFVGIAPDARIINVKVGAADGAADVSQVIAAIDWVTQHAHDPGYNIKVINLSYGTASTQGWTVDPLAYAASQAWDHGIVVVAAAGNDGAAASSDGTLLPLADPAYDPQVLAVGTVDPSTATVPTFAQHGTLLRPVDVVTPGVHILGLRVPGSFIDTLATNTGQVGSRFQLGSGTSESAAIVSGMVALLAQKYPAATPDQLKKLLDQTATTLLRNGKTIPLDGIRTYYSGHGLANLTNALTAALPANGQLLLATPTGTGLLEAGRGGVYVADNGVNLSGEQDIFGHQFNSASMAALEASASSWSGGTWNGNTWSGNGWCAKGWCTATWSGKDWAGNPWSGSRWSGMTWTGSRWSGAGWNGSRWTGSTWTGSRWSSFSWS
ncbi:MAG TPA: S8 family serine peptidase [Acidimicrobiales bacterium]|nr:S8 family serine peptidase [Acidimicrobiales bacterium]